MTTLEFSSVTTTVFAWFAAWFCNAYLLSQLVSGSFPQSNWLKSCSLVGFSGFETINGPIRQAAQVAFAN